MIAPQIKTVGDLIDLWASTPIGRKRKSHVALAADLGGIPPTTVRTMRQRNAIARKHWPALLESARKHALDPQCSELFSRVSAQLLVDIMSNPIKPDSDVTEGTLPQLAA